MATIKVAKTELEKYTPLTPQAYATMNLMGIPIEAVHDQEVEYEVLPNRPDTLSVQGYLRAFKAYFGKEPGLKKYTVKKPEKDFVVRVDSSLKNIRPYTACAIIKNLAFNDAKIKEMIDMQEKLHTTVGRNRKKLAIGIYPLEKISLPITFEARKPKDIRFIPLESEREMNGLEILQRHPTGREYASLLDGLEKYPVFVDNKGKILSLPPIINSHETGKVTYQTSEIFIECSGFDFSILKKALNILVTMFADMGGTIYQMEVVYDNKVITPDLSPEKVKLSLEHTNKLLGLNLKEKDLETLLPRMGYDYAKGTVMVPAWRVDILHEVDIIEDIAIAYGYDRLIPQIPKVATIGEESEESKLTRKLASILVGLGLLEASTYHLIKEEEAKRAKLGEEKVETENSKTEYKILRPNLLIPALRIFSENKDNEYPQKIFEIGTVFKKSKLSETGIAESEHLLIACSPSNFTDLKQILDYLSKMAGFSYALKEGTHQDLIEGRTGVISIHGKETGFIGEVHPETLQDWNIKMPVTVIEFSLRELLSKS